MLASTAHVVPPIVAVAVGPNDVPESVIVVPPDVGPVAGLAVTPDGAAGTQHRKHRERAREEHTRHTQGEKRQKKQNKALQRKEQTRYIRS